MHHVQTNAKNKRRLLGRSAASYKYSQLPTLPCIQTQHSGLRQITSAMATDDAPSNPCAVCGKEAKTHCAGCTAGEDSTLHLPRTFYCGKDCQVEHWETHKGPCKAALPLVKLFRAGKILQEVFLATRAESFDYLLASVGRQADGEIHIFDASTRGVLARVVTLPAFIASQPDDIKRAVLSYNAGSDILTCMLYKLSTEAFKGKSSSDCPEVRSGTRLTKHIRLCT